MSSQEEQQSTQDQLNDINSADKFINKDQQVLEIETKTELEIDTVNDGGEGSVTVIKMEDVEQSVNESDKVQDISDGANSVVKDRNPIDAQNSVVNTNEANNKDRDLIDGQNSVNNTGESAEKDDNVINGQNSVSNTVEPIGHDAALSVVEIGDETGDKEMSKANDDGENEENMETETMERDEVAEAVQGKLLPFR